MTRGLSAIIFNLICLSIALAALCLMLTLSNGGSRRYSRHLDAPAPYIQHCANREANFGIPASGSFLTNKDFRDMSRAEVKQVSRARYQERLQTLEHYCSTWYEATRYKRNRRQQWYHLKPYNVLACLNHKSGSTTIRHNIAEALARVKSKKKGLPTKKKVPRGKSLLQCSKTQLEEYKNKNDTFVFVMVRHPLEHLVSGYNQFLKLKHPQMDKYFNESNADHPLSPSQMVDRLIDHRVWMERCLHLAPYYQNCGLCSGDFKVDAVLKMETWDEDMQFLSDALQIKEFQSSGTHLNPHSGKKEDQMRKFFSNLTRTQFEKIVEFYRPDFDMYGYDPSPFYKYLDVMST